MKIKSLLLGSIAAAGLSTGAYAADLSVLTSLDVCDALGISGLTISSDTNCLQITGEVSYEFNWGDYNGTVAGWVMPGADGQFAIDGVSNFTIDDNDSAGADEDQDWSSKVTAWLKFVATADSDFGPAKAVIKLKSEDESVWENEITNSTVSDTSVFIDEAYVSVGDSTVLMAGRKGSIGNTNDDEPYNFLGLFNSEKVDAGVGWSAAAPVADGGHVIQVVSDLGNGVSVGLGLEDLQADGTLVGVMSYAGDTVGAHATFYATDILDGAITNWAVHAGATVTVDSMNFRAAVAADDTGWWNALASAEATFDMFTLAGSVEATSASELGFGGSASAEVTDGVSINVGARWWDTDTATANTEIWHAAVQLIADVTETVTLTGELGLHAENNTNTNVTYGAAQLAWAPGGGFTSSVKGQVNSAGAYKVSFKAAKSFE